MPGAFAAPQLVQLARQTAGGTYDNGVAVAGPVHGADHLRVGWQGRRRWRQRACRVGLPGRLRLRNRPSPRPRRSPATEPGTQPFEPGACIGDQRDAAVLAGIERLHVEADDLHPRVLEQRSRSGGEILQPGADGQDHVRLGGQRVGRRRAGDADGAEAHRMIVGRAPTCRPASRRPGCRGGRRRPQALPVRRRNGRRRRRRSAACWRLAAASLPAPAPAHPVAAGAGPIAAARRTSSG